MISNELEDLFDKAVSQDFIVHRITKDDEENDSYKALKFTLAFNNINIKYQRKVESLKHLKLPRFQYLFGFYPKDGICLYVNKKEHKIALCEGPLQEISNNCLLIHSLFYLLVPQDKFEVYSYLPACCEINCPNSPKQYKLRIKLYVE